ncbi:MAG TPA: replication protein RepA [Noviherbaspirillum sp.]|nr:replication protein RepA [Noviherbaspirillum sp.]
MSLQLWLPDEAAKTTRHGEVGETKPVKNTLQFFAPLKGDLTTRQRRMIEDALAIEQEDARAAGATGFMIRTLAQATLPHLDPKLPMGMLYSRNTGCLTLTIAPTSPKHGIPYGSIPRIIMAWLCTEVVLNKDRIQLDRTISLGDSQAEFLEKLQMHNNGHDIRRFKDHSLRLFKSIISTEYTDDSQGDRSKRLLITDQSNVFWHSNKGSQGSLWESTLLLSENFCKEVLEAAVPFDMRVYHSLSKSPLAMDIYTWVTYRMFVLRRSGRPFVLIPWSGLMRQMGSNYGKGLTISGEHKAIDERQALYSFKSNFIKRLRDVLIFYPEARDHIEDTGDMLKLTPCDLHLPHRKKSTTYLFK